MSQLTVLRPSATPPAGASYLVVVSAMNRGAMAGEAWLEMGRRSHANGFVSKWWGPKTGETHGFPRDSNARACRGWKKQYQSGSLNHSMRRDIWVCMYQDGSPLSGSKGIPKPSCGSGETPAGLEPSVD